MAKKRYYVEIREVYVSTREVHAESPDEALDLAGDCKEVYRDYSHTLDKDTWTVEEAGNEGKEVNGLSSIAKTA